MPLMEGRSLFLLAKASRKHSTNDSRIRRFDPTVDKVIIWQQISLGG